MADTTDKYAAYGETVLEIPGVPEGRVDLRRPVGARERTLLRGLGLLDTFAVMTAENPGGRNDEDAPSEAEQQARAARNDRHLARLIGTLAAMQLPFVRIDGTAPDGSYRERCVAVSASRETALGLARRFEQLALFWFDGDAFWLLPADADEPPRKLPSADPR